MIVCVRYANVGIDNVDVAVIITRFQQPVADVFFSDNVLVTTRNGVPHIMFRVGNGRANVLFSPNIIVSVLRSVVTVSLWCTVLVD